MPIVKGPKRAERFLRFLLGAWTVDAEALLIERAVKSFDVGILLGMMRITEVHLDAQTTAKAQQR
ncbi:hypothetical protein ccbrp13_12550 [Ktedonobacteria bacterium brp13]|nr:hypothetical protein ccbrp13_12550 [Ktedonobacteria bacterium brp13]